LIVDNPGESSKRIPIGTPIANSSAYIVDRTGHLVPIGVPGELLVGGDGVARGYLNNPGLTAERFIRINRSYRSYRSYISYRTGDLARWLPDGSIDFLGRIDQQVKIRGFRIELEGIRNLLLKHKDIEDVAVIARRDETGENHICAYVVPASSPGAGSALIPQLRDWLAEKLPVYMVPAHFGVLEQLPLTPNGKLDRRALPVPEIMSGKAYHPPRDKQEQALAAMWAEVLGIEKEKIGIDDDFFELGGHSLKATGLIGRIHKTFDIKIPLARLFKTPTIRGISRCMAEAGKSRYLPLKPVKKREYYPSSSAQKRLYVLQQMDKDAAVYNISSVVILEGALNGDRLEHAFKKLVARHESLRTSFVMVGEEPVQKIHEQVEFAIEYHELDHFVQPFELSRAPLLRVGLIKESGGKHLLMVDIHHIISDGISVGILLREFKAFYTGEEPAPLRLQYRDFSQWQLRRQERGLLKTQETYWLQTFAEEIPVVDLPMDFPRPAVQGFAGSRLTFEIPGADTRALKTLAFQEGVTTFMVLLAVVNILLARLSGLEDIVVGTPAAGRSHPDLEFIIGMFVNTLPLRNKPAGEKSLRAFLREVKENTLAAFQNQDYPFEELVERVEINRDVSRNPLFDVMFVLQELDISGIEIEPPTIGRGTGLVLKSYPFETNTAKFDLTAEAVETGENLVFTFEYSTTLFKKTTVERFAGYFKKIISETAADNETILAGIDILSEEEKQEILFDFNDTDADYPRNKTVHRLFAEQAGKTPGNIAVVGMEHGARSMERDGGLQHLSYRELNRRSDQLACLLMEKGVVPGAAAAIMLERSVEMIIGILAILKAGGAYLPIDPGYPEERIHYMLADSSAKVLVSGDIEAIDLNKKIIGPIGPIGPIQATQPCCIIYTSGSTGRPKGVKVEHGSVVNILWTMQQQFPLLEADTYLLKTSYTFDVSVAELFGWFFDGGRLAVLEKGGEKDPKEILAAIENHSVTHINFVPSQFNAFVDVLSRNNIGKLSSLKYIFLAGEALQPGVVNNFNSFHCNIQVENLYGPTEATVYASWYSLQRWDGSGTIPIGKPLSNVRLYILDKYDHPQAIGVPGELCIAGTGLARGYLNNPELTAGRFKFNRSYKSYRSYISYHTGDLVRWLPHGNIEFLGRMDSQVKIRGFRIELGEIENQLLSHPDIKEAVATARAAGSDGGGGRYICAYIVPHLSLSPVPLETARLKSYLLERLPDYMVPTHFVVLEKLPVTTSGKIDRKSLPEPENRPAGKYAAPRNAVEKRLVNIWSDVLGIREEKVGIDDNFFELGGHSLKATALVTRIHKHFDIEVPLSQLFHAPTVRQLSSYIRENSRQKQLLIKSSEERDYYELTAAQKRFFIFQQMEPDSVSYNMPKALRLEGKVSKEEFEETFKQLIRRQESLRTFFELVDGEPVQRVLKEKEITFEIESCHIALTADDQRVWAANRGKPGQLPAIERDFVRPFDLGCPPLMRVRLVKAGPELYFLLFDMHHIITDGVSIGIFIKEFLALYNREALQGLPIRYKDYVNWEEQRRIKGAPGQAQVSPGDVLNLPTDYVRPAVPTFEGDTIIFELDEQVKKALILMAAKQQDTTVYMILLSVFYILLSKLSGQESIVVGSPMAGRLHQDLEGLIGLFINTLVLRDFLSGEKVFSEFLAEVKENVLQAFDNQEYQYEQLVDAFAAARETGRNPLFDVMFAFQNMEMPEVEIPGMQVFIYPEQGWSSKFDMTLYCEEHNNYLFKWEYSTRLFKPGTIRRFSRYFKKITSEILADPHKKISGIDILSGEEKRQILVDFNDTAVEFPREKTVFQRFQEQAGQTPGRTAVIGVAHGAWSTAGYRELNEKSNQLARLLRRRGLKANRAAGIMMERSLWALVAIYAVLKAGGAYLPIDPEYPDNRITGMLEKSGASLLLTTREIAAKKSLHSLSRGQEVLVLDEAEQSGELERESPANLEPVSGPGDLIYIIFTSGSTGTPKGAGVYHRGFMNLVHWFVTEFQLDGSDRNLWLTSLSFDLTQKNLYAPLVSGGTLCIPRFNYFEPRSLLREIHEHRVTWINCTPSMFYKMVEYESAGEEKRLTLLRYVFLGGESISMPVLIDWLESEHCRAELVNTYGPTECTDISNYYRVKNPRQFLGQNIPVGYPVYNVQLFVPDRYLQPVPVGVPGELLIGGSSVGIGYIDDRELTAQKFIRHSFAGEPERVLYRTGDLVRWLPEGTVEFLGRIDHQVKVRGFRIELGEIESQLLNHPKVKETVVMARQGEGGPDDTYLCAYVIPIPPHTPGTADALRAAELREHLAVELPDYMVPPYFVMLEKMPLNPNGKVDRKALPEPDRTAGRDYVPPRDEREKVLVGIWSEVLGVPGSRIGIHDNFFRLGGHSLKAAALAAQIHKAFSVEIPIAELFKKPTVKGIGRYIEKCEESIYSALEPVEKREYYPLSSAQKRLYLLYRLDSGNTAYNIPEALVLEGNVERERLENTFIQLIARHESLRTSFEMLAEEPVQKIHRDVDFEIEYYPAAPDPLPLISQFIRPFDLFRAPLIRVGLVEIEKEKYLLLMDMHHIISDAISRDIFIRDFTALYPGSELSSLKVTYKDYSGWQNREKESVKQQEDFWIGEFAGEIPVLELPTDYARPTVQGFEGGRLSFYLEEKETRALTQLALKQEATLYMILMALYNILLSRLSGREDIVVGSPIAGRRHADLEQIIGMFVNTLPLRNYPSAQHRFSEFLKNVGERTLMALENQDYPFEDLVDNVAVKRDISRNPLFDVVFVMQNEQVPEIRLPGLTLTPLAYEGDTSKFDITFIAFETGKELGFLFEYDSKLFKEDSIRRFSNYFKKIVSDILEHPDIKLSDIEIISGEEKRQILMDFNNTTVDYPGEKTIHRLFADQVTRTPDGIALKGMERFCQWTYRHLDTISNRLADRLMEKGGKPGTIVGIIGGRSPGMVSGILGILKTGGVYLPIDADYPAERQRCMLDDSKAGILLSEVNGGLELIALEHLSTHPLTHSTTQPAYIMYTSGSTGRPKGVLVTHRNVVRLVKNTNYVVLNQETRVLQTGAPVFDAATFEIWGSLLNGGQLVLTSKEVILDAHRLGDALEACCIDTLWLSAPLFNHLMQQNIGLFSPLRYLLVGGDILSPAHISRVKQKFPQLNIINGYGPTENTTFSTTYLIEKEFEQNIPIGSPIANSVAYIVDRNDHLLPIGIYGELLVGGDGLSPGYLNNPEMTNSKFQITNHKSQIINKEKGPPLRFSASQLLSFSLYRTGDLARWLPDGNIEFSGRIDQQVKIRGFRVEPGEIEDHLLKIDRVKETVVIPVRDEEGNKSLCAYIVADNEIPVTELRNNLLRHLPDYMIPAYFTFLEKIPLTANGKVNRKALPAPRARVTGVYSAPKNEIERRMAGVWASVLNIDSETVGIDSDFFEMGGDSLKATILVSKIHQAFDVKIPLAQVFQKPVIRELAEYMKEAAEEVFVSIELAEKKDYYLLSSAQKRLYLLYQSDRGSTAYNMPRVFMLEGVLEKEKLESIFKQLILGHGSFRTSFQQVKGEPVQRIHEENFKFQVLNYKDPGGGGLSGGLQDIIKNSVRPFDLSQAPLLRVGLIKLGEEKHVMMVDMHHIISDGISIGILAREFMALYAGEPLGRPRLAYIDYVCWQESETWQESLKAAETFWLGRFMGTGAPPQLRLPTDYARPVERSFEGAALEFALGAAETAALKRAAEEEEATLFMILLAFFNILLARLSGQEDIIVGTPVMGRPREELQHIIGMFVNTLPLRNFPKAGYTFRDFLKQVKEQTLNAFEYQHIPFEKLVEKIELKRDNSRSPLFDVMFAFQNLEIPEFRIPRLTLTPYPYEGVTSKFDLNLIGTETNGGLGFILEYGTKLFKADTIERFVHYFKDIITTVLEDRDIRLGDIKIHLELSESESALALEAEGDFGF
jgi:tyrocidine synthetase-3